MKSVEVLIVDEAAQAVEPEVLIPLALNPKRCGKRAFFEPYSFMYK
jgi:superfamily I DNA and/or RNA helicase